MKKNVNSLIFGAFLVLIFSKLGHAQNVDDIAQNIVASSGHLPAIVSALCYLGGLLFTVTAIFKTIDHVNNPTQTTLNVPVIRYVIGGGLFALPFVMEAVYVTINGGPAATNFDPLTDSVNIFGDWLLVVHGLATGAPAANNNINAVMEHMTGSISHMPALVSAVSYLLGLVITVSALYKTRDHVEDPNRVPLKDAVIRYITAGALFALPMVFESMYETISSTGLGAIAGLGLVFAPAIFVFSSETNNAECGAALGAGVNSTLGDVICSGFINSADLPFFLNSISYLVGLALGVWGVLKIRDHVIEPSRTQLSEGVMRMIAGGCFFSLPYIIYSFRQSFLTAGLDAFSSAQTNTNFHTSITAASCGTTNSLDEAMGCFMLNILGPAHVALNFFCFCAGVIFLMIGISRLIKSSQEGPRGPGGIGTFGTFVIGGMLLSATNILRAFSASFFNDTVTYTWAQLNYTVGMTNAEQQAVHNVISAVLQFLIVLGMISFVRGMFIIREVAEGKGNSSLMAGVTHLIGGALAVNMGPLLNAIQQTLGITAFGIDFT